MFIKTAPRKNGGLSIRVVESYWDGKGSRHRTLLSLGSGDTPQEIKSLKAKAQRAMIKLQQARQAALPGMAKEIYGSKKRRGRPRKKTHIRRASKQRFPLLSDVHETERVIEGIASVCGALYEQCGFQDIIQGAGDDREWNEILKACVISRVSDPCSKRRTAQILDKDYAHSIPLEKIYRMMDHLFQCRERALHKVSQNTLDLFKQQTDVLLFDVTTLYFESAAVDELRAFGFSKDCKFKEVQVLLALITNHEGHPLSYELFPGNVSEGSVLIETVEKLKKRLSVRKAAMIADRAMFSEKNLQFMDKMGIEYAVAAKLRALPKDLKEKIVNSGLNKLHLKRMKEREEEKKGAEERKGEKEQKERKGEEREERQEEGKEAHRAEERLESPTLDLNYKGQRIIVHWSRKRAEKDAKDRERLIQRLMTKIKEDKISVQKLIPNYGTKKYIKIDKGSRAALDQGKVEKEALWDGFHGIATNVQGERGKALLKRYRELWRIEEAFRVNKHTLKMRPIYHWKPRRVHAHISICFLAYSLSFTIRKLLNRAGLNLSVEKIREILKRDQYSVLEDQKTGQQYRIPSKWTQPLRQIYEAFGLKRASKVTAL